MTKKPPPPELPDENGEPAPELSAELRLLLGLPSDTDMVLEEYLNHVANDGLLPYQAILQYGGKQGESLYQHIVKGIFLLHTLANLLGLDEVERRVLYTAFSIHDLNKNPLGTTTATRYVELTKVDQLEPYISTYKLDMFFRGYEEYLDDIQFLIQRHGAQTPTGTAHRRATTAYTLSRTQLERLLKLVQAADKSAMAHSVGDQQQLASMLHHLNAASATPYRLVTHQLGEQRGSFTNMIHNAVMAELQHRAGLIPLLCYPDGVVYLQPIAAALPTLDDTTIEAIARRVAQAINAITGNNYAQFISPGNMGISVGVECLNLGIRMDDIVGTITGILERRPYKSDKLEQLRNDSRRRTTEALAGADPTLAAAVNDVLETGAVPQTPAGMRAAELLRTYYIFLKEHFAAAIPDAWHHLYTLLGIPAEQQPLYDVFDPRMDRASAITAHRGLSFDQVTTCIVADGQAWLDQRAIADPRLPDLVAYLRLMLTFSTRTVQPGDYAPALVGYVTSQHKQCSICSLPFPTAPLMSGDVRDGLKVQFFSNRLRGGSSEPKRNICPICQMHLLIEKLNYPDRGGEDVWYLHCFPYGFVPAPMVEALATSFRRANEQNTLQGALRLISPEAMLNELNDVVETVAQQLPPKAIAVNFATHTRQNKAQPFGVFIPRFSSTCGAVFTLPINTPVERGESHNATAQFLFALIHAVILQYHLGCRVLLSRSAVPTLPAEALPDLYVDSVPVSMQGLLRRPDFATYIGQTSKPGPLVRLRRRLNWLLQIRSQVGDPQQGDEELAHLARALGEHPLAIWHVAERRATRRYTDERKRMAALQRAVGLIHALVIDLLDEYKDETMTKLSTHLQELARIAWTGGLRGRSWKKNSLLAPITEVFHKLERVYPGSPLNPDMLQAAAINDLVEHIERIRSGQGKQVGYQKLRAGSEAFIHYFFTHVYTETYQQRLSRLLADRKIIMSAFYFYLLQERADFFAARAPATSDGTDADATHLDDDLTDGDDSDNGDDDDDGDSGDDEIV